MKIVTSPDYKCPTCCNYRCSATRVKDAWCKSNLMKLLQESDLYFYKSSTCTEINTSRMSLVNIDYDL